MSEIAHLRSKAETCLRLAEAASSARATELFKRMAGEYRAQADELEGPMASPSLVPPAMEVRSEINSAAVAPMSPCEAVVEDEELVAPSLAPVTGMDEQITGINDQFTGMDTGKSEPFTDMIPLAGPQANSAQWLAELQALRNRL